jgi:phage terminase large subunit
MERVQPNKIVFPPKFEALFKPFRWKVWYGGRSSSKSWSCARAIILLTDAKRLRVLCTREFQSSIRDSVHRLLSDQIQMLGLAPWFEITDKEIRSLRTGSEIIFRGLHHNLQEIKSLEGVDICFCEESQLISNDSWIALIPTIRKPGSELWVVFNVVDETDATYQRCVIQKLPNAYVCKVGWEDNPHFSDTLNAEREYMLRTDPENYEWVWSGNPRVISDAIIFKGKYTIESFEMPTNPRPQLYHGCDWGYAADPLCLVRCWITGEAPEEHLFIDEEAVSYHCELDNIPALFDSIPTSRDWSVKCDPSRPETISYVAKRGFNCTPADSWKGSVEDGIAHLRSYRIHVHQRCTHLLQELRSYAWKTDRNTGEILPIPCDRSNHCIDALRYAIPIKRRGAMAVWRKLGEDW